MIEALCRLSVRYRVQRRGGKRRHGLFVAASTLLVSVTTAGSLESADATAASILRERCVGCHGAEKSSARLRLDSLEAILEGSRKGPVVVPGASDQSKLVHRVEDREDPMPPEGKGEPLAEADVAVLRRWIDRGATAETFGSAAAPEVVEITAGALPVEWTPVFTLAGDPQSERLAIGRGDRVEVYAVVKRPTSEEKNASEEPTAVLVERLFGHGDVVQTVAFSPDGRYLASGEYRTVRIWKTDGWKLVQTLDGHADRVLALCFSADGERLFAGSGYPTSSGEVTAWRVGDGERLWHVKPHSDTVLALGLSPDGETLATGGADRVTYLLSSASGATVRRLEGHTDHVLDLAWRPDGEQLATVGADRRLRLWDMETLGLERTRSEHGSDATAVAYQSDGQQIVTASDDESVRFFDPRNGRQRRIFREARGPLHCGSFFAGGERYATAEIDGRLLVYDVPRNRLLFSIDLPDARLRAF